MLPAGVRRASAGEVPGFVARDSEWWELTRLADPEHWRRGAGPKFFARDRARRRAGWLRDLPHQVRLAGRVSRRARSSWSRRSPTSPAATRELYRFLFGIDLVVRVQGRYDPGSPLFLMVADPRSLHLKCLRGSLAPPRRSRSARLPDAPTPATTTVVVDVADSFCPWNAGRWRDRQDGGADG